MSETACEPNQNNIEHQYNEIMDLIDGKKTHYLPNALDSKQVLNTTKEMAKKLGSYRMTFVKDKKVVAMVPVIAGVVAARVFPFITLIALVVALYRKYAIVIDKGNK